MERNEEIRLIYKWYEVPEEIRERIQLPDKLAVPLEEDGKHPDVIFNNIVPRGVELFTLQQIPIDYMKVRGDCAWTTWEALKPEPDTGIHLIKGNFICHGCPFLPPGVSVPITVGMIYCRASSRGLLCKRKELEVSIGERCISFAAEQSFIPRYRNWIEEVMEWKGLSAKLPDVLEPNKNYQFCA